MVNVTLPKEAYKIISQEDPTPPTPGIRIGFDMTADLDGYTGAEINRNGLCVGMMEFDYDTDDTADKMFQYGSVELDISYNTRNGFHINAKIRASREYWRDALKAWCLQIEKESMEWTE